MGRTAGQVKVWTLDICGGQQFELRVPRHPVLQHDGRKTIWKFLGSKEAVEEVIRTMVDGQGVSVVAHTEEEDATV